MTSVLLVLLYSFSPCISAIALLLKEDIWLRKRVRELGRYGYTVS
jgi:hypothetical protein